MVAGVYKTRLSRATDVGVFAVNLKPIQIGQYRLKIPPTGERPVRQSEDGNLALAYRGSSHCQWTIFRLDFPEQVLWSG